MSVVRVIIFVLVVVLLIREARRAPARSRRQRAFWLAAGALSLFALLNGLQVAGMNTDALLLPVLALGVTLLAISVVLLYRAWRHGEMNEQIARMREALAEERERHKKE
jgi:quinol-cytochrome oxidoreductase complex cytochrome b subunit